jgi:hypothetical protein
LLIIFLVNFENQTWDSVFIIIMGSSSECYVLKWNEFHASVANSFTDLRNEDEFLDVTVAIDQDHQLRAHKVILSASSPYFRSLLKRNPAQHPVLVMPPNIRYSDLVAVIDFIYQGEVKIPDTEFNEFVSLAQLLKIKGLTEDSMEKGDTKKAKTPHQQQPKLPSGTQMVRGRSGPPPPCTQQAKRPRLLGPPSMENTSKFGGPPGLHQMNTPTPEEKEFNEDDLDDEDDDDVHEVEDDDSNAIYAGYEEEQYEGQEFPQTPSQQPEPGPSGPPPSAPSQPQAGTSGSAGLLLTGLLCPKCRVMCHGVEALKEHMGKAHGMSTGPTTADQPPQPQEEDKKYHICHICDKGFKTAKYVQAHIKRVHKVARALDQHHQPEDPGMLMDPNQPGMLSPPKKKAGRPKKKDQVGNSVAPQGFDQGMMAGRPIGQVPPAPRQSSQDVPEASRPPIQHQQDRNSPMMMNQRQRPSPCSPSKRPMQPQGLIGQQEFRPRCPPPLLLQQQHQQQQMPQQGHHPQQTMDIKRLGMKLGGSISIISSEPLSGMPPQAAPRRPITTTSRTQPGHVSSPRSDALSTSSSSSSRPPVSAGQRQVGALIQPDPLEVKEEPMDDMYEEGEEMPEEDYEEGEEAYGEEEEEEEEDDGDYGQVAHDGMYGAEAPYDDNEGDRGGNYQQQ